MPTRMNDHPSAHQTMMLSAEQFDKIVDLLTPGYELSKLMLADYMERATAPHPSHEPKLPYREPPADLPGADDTAGD